MNKRYFLIHNLSAGEMPPPPFVPLGWMALGIIAHLAFNGIKSTTAEELLAANPSSDIGRIIPALEELETAGYIKEVK